MLVSVWNCSEIQTIFIQKTEPNSKKYKRISLDINVRYPIQKISLKTQKYKREICKQCLHRINIRLGVSFPDVYFLK